MLWRRHGRAVTVGEVVARLICKHCRARPEVVELVDDPQVEAPGYVTYSGRRAVRVRVLG
jgi:hypothetical protein